ncbi:MAG TPA: FHA domain-containing protein [Pyrinomonadaceae bacterium]|jgi:pSer/pThr/pTyr-binding forkhead associated (FHA) protein|nr:FHA domain-containing protein [Pyrinomonadaceae bacterium]
MGTVHESVFIIAREDRSVDPKTVVSEGLRIGRLPDSDIWLNHSTVSRLHAGINKIEEYFYLINLSASSATTLNGRAIPFNEAEALADGDIIRIGPFFLNVEVTDEVCRLSVTVQFALNVGEQEARHTMHADTGPLIIKKRVTGSLSDVANALKVFWGKRTREKAGRPSPLHPRTPPRLGKIRFNWIPTRDLVRPWPFAIFIWAPIVVGSLSVAAAFKYRIAFAPEPISTAHTRTAFTLTPSIAKQPNGSSCTSCHVLGVSVKNKEKMNANCAACHYTESFVPTVISAHRAAGLTCTACHTEHRGENFRPMNAALDSCANCHNDLNKNLYNGKGVYTAHGGTYGYPVINGVWVWRGLDSEELEAKPEIVELLKKNRVTPSQTQQWRNAQFHAIHVHRIHVVPGISGIEGADAVNEVISCNSCHKTGYMGANVDRDYPRTTCRHCHNTKVFEKTLEVSSIDRPSCTSCHVQHIKDMHWAAPLRITQASVAEQ